MRSRNEVVKLATSWLGKKESDGSYKSIIDLYNSFDGQLPRGIKMQYDWAWCACTWSALAIGLGYTDIMPIEISCGELIKKAQKMGCWHEYDGYIPSPGDAILYDWEDDGVGDDTGWPNHVGTVEYCDEDSGYITVIEGNYKNSVKKRTISINGIYIRGFIAPKYDNHDIVYEELGTSKDVSVVAREVIAGLWGNGDARKLALERNGLNYEDVRAKVNEILNGPAKKPLPPSTKEVKTTCYARNMKSSYAGQYTTSTDLYCRNDAGTNKKALCLIPKGTIVHNFGYYNVFGDTVWLMIQFELNGVKYTGFSSIKYLKR